MPPPCASDALKSRHRHRSAVDARTFFFGPPPSTLRRTAAAAVCAPPPPPRIGRVVPATLHFVCAACGCALHRGTMPTAAGGGRHRALFQPTASRWIIHLGSLPPLYSVPSFSPHRPTHPPPTHQRATTTPTTRTAEPPRTSQPCRTPLQQPRRPPPTARVARWPRSSSSASAGTSASSGAFCVWPCLAFGLAALASLPFFLWSHCRIRLNPSNPPHTTPHHTTSPPYLSPHITIATTHTRTPLPNSKPPSCSPFFPHRNP